MVFCTAVILGSLNTLTGGIELYKVLRLLLYSVLLLQLKFYTVRYTAYKSRRALESPGRTNRRALRYAEWCAMLSVLSGGLYRGRTRLSRPSRTKLAAYLTPGSWPAQLRKQSLVNVGEPA